MVDNGEANGTRKSLQHYYGTPRLPVEEALTRGRDVIFDIDWQGTQQLREQRESDLVTVFLCHRIPKNWNAAFAPVHKTPNHPPPDGQSHR